MALINNEPHKMRTISARIGGVAFYRRGCHTVCKISEMHEAPFFLFGSNT
jgi:hypothetical protein